MKTVNVLLLGAVSDKAVEQIAAVDPAVHVIDARGQFEVEYAQTWPAETVWRYDGQAVTIFTLEHGEYRTQEASIVLPNLTSQVITRFLQDSQAMKCSAWLRSVCEWAQKRGD